MRSASITILLSLIFLQGCSSMKRPETYKEREERLDPYYQMYNGIFEGDIKKIKGAMSRGLDLSTYARDETRGESPVQMCVSSDCTVATLKWLLENGASPTKIRLVDTTGEWIEGNLLERINADGSPDLMAFVSGNSYVSNTSEPSHSKLEQSLRNAIVLSSDYALAEKLLSQGADINGIGYRAGEHESGATILNECLIAIRNCSYEDFEFLLSNGADLEKMFWNGKQGKKKWLGSQSAISDAVDDGLDFDIIRLLSNHANDEILRRGLNEAIKSNNLKIVKFFVEEENISLGLESGEYTPYHEAIRHGRISLIKYFVEDQGVPVDLTAYGDGILIHAADSGNRENADDIVETLLRLGANPYQVRASDQKTWLSILEDRIKSYDEFVRVRDGRRQRLLAKEEAERLEHARKKRARRDFWGKFLSVAAESANTSLGGSSIANSNAYANASTDSIDQMYNETMNNIRAMDQSARTQEKTEYTEKQNCVNAGRNWTGSSCDYSFTVTQQSESQGRTATVDPAAAHSSSSNSGGSSPTPTSGQITGSDYRDRASVQTQSSTAANQKAIRAIPVFVQIENDHGWSTQEEACKYAKNKAIDIAQSQCRSEHGGVPATKNDAPAIPRPYDANCQSYRQLEKAEFTGQLGQWKTTGNVILQCRLLD